MARATTWLVLCDFWFGLVSSNSNLVTHKKRTSSPLCLTFACEQQGARQFLPKRGITHYTHKLPRHTTSKVVPDMEADSLPMQSAPHDTLRYGLSTLKDEASVAHPVQALEQKVGLDHQPALLQLKPAGTTACPQLELGRAVSRTAVEQQGEDAEFCVRQRFLSTLADREANSGQVRTLYIICLAARVSLLLLCA